MINRRRAIGTLGAVAGAVACPALGRSEAPAWSATEFHKARRFETLPEGRIAYVERGNGPAALFIHGWPLNGYQWRHVMAALSPVRRCIAPDLMGLGYSEVGGDQELSPVKQAKMLGTLMSRLGVEAFDVVANDSGTAIAQLLAVAEPRRVRSLLLTNGDVHTNSPPELLKPAISAARKGELVSMFRAHLDDPGFASSPEGLGSICYQDPATLGRSSCEVYFRPLLANPRREAQGQRYGVEFEPNPLPGIENQLAGLHLPAKLVWGLADPIFDVRWAEWLDRKLPESTGVTRLEKAKLFFPEERWRELSQAALQLWRA